MECPKCGFQMKCAKCGKNTLLLCGIFVGKRGWRVCSECRDKIMEAAEKAMDYAKLALLADCEPEPKCI